tara:strand:+ start:65 stop:301 length:237 start_codon:yes stop_codon:yes gene_type:complete
MITEATQKDWTNFWEESTMNATATKTRENISIDEARQLRDEIIEQIEVAFAIWGDEDCFEQRAISSLISDSFVDKGVM